MTPDRTPQQHAPLSHRLGGAANHPQTSFNLFASLCLLLLLMPSLSAQAAPGAKGQPKARRSWSAQAMAQLAAKHGRFPQVKGTAISKRKRSLPADFPGTVNFVMLGFARAHQKPLQSWLPYIQSAARQYPGLDFMGMPVLGGFARLFGGLIEGGMRRTYKSPHTQARMMLLYSVKSTLVKSLRLRSTKRLTLLLVDQQGRVFWRATGPKTTATVASLNATLKALKTTPKPTPKPKARQKKK